MNKLSFRTIVITMLVTATVLVAGVANFRAAAVEQAPAAPHTMLVPF